MLDKKHKIIESIRKHIILNEGRDWSSEQYEEYFLKEYVSPIFYKIDDDTFFSYKVGESYIWIQDFVANNPIKAYCLYKKIQKLKENHKLTIRCQCAITNISHLTCTIRLGFKIIDLIGYNYILEDKFKES